MDFCKLLHTAQKNDKSSSSGVRYYSTKFEPPKKIKKESKELSDNIKKFLAKKEAEEQKKNQDAKRKKEELLALRAQDKKATKRISFMLKRTKSANQSVIEDAVDNSHTAVTLAGPDQPDEDDYGYVSQEASAFYEKMMEKYSKMPEEPKFNLLKKKVSTNLNSTKDRVKAALEKEREEAMQPHRRKRRRKEDENGDKVVEHGSESPDRKGSDNSSKDTKDIKIKPKPKPAPPPMSFTDLLKIAEKKQFEPIVIEQKPKEEEKLFTKKQKKEMEREKEWKERREARYRDMENKDKAKDRGGRTSDSVKSNSGSEVTKSNGSSKILEKQLTKPMQKDSMDKEKQPNKNGKLPSTNVSGLSKSLGNGQFKKPYTENKYPKPTDRDEARFNKDSQNNRASSSASSNSKMPSNKNSDQRNSSVSKNNLREDILKKSTPVGSGKLHEKPKEFPPRDLLPKGKQLPPKDIRPKQFPPPDVRGIKKKRPMPVKKGRILDDSEEEYDSELDDFIDDGPEEDSNYSSYIKEIFGYDKSRYRDHDDDVDNMESTFAQQMKEEVISTKIGIMEDLEDMKLEEEQKRRKALMKKKMKR
ncbi:protein SPT2 homolog [Rhynchophorus ferrugineus]|uniref:protein SPT2 homolog n=1 Tax=Rhynchophorus ferrugineus TaxID=354439 RepID=UPI003FCE82FD